MRWHETASKGGEILKKDPMIRNRYLTSSHASRNRQDIWEIDRSCAILSRHPFFPKTTLPTVNFPPESFEANGRSNLRRRKCGLAFPNGSGAWPCWPDCRTGGERVWQQRGGKDRHWAPPAATYRPRPGPTPAKLTFAEATKTFGARSAEHCHSYDWLSFVVHTNRKKNNSKESFVFVINENILNNSLGLN